MVTEYQMNGSDVKITLVVLPGKSTVNILTILDIQEGENKGDC